MGSEKSKFKKFYFYGSVLWLLMLIIFISGKHFIDSYESHNSNMDFLDGLLSIVLTFGVFGIPIIFVISFFLRMAEYFIRKIPTKPINI